MFFKINSVIIKYFKWKIYKELNSISLSNIQLCKLNFNEFYFKIVNKILYKFINHSKLMWN